MKDWQPVAELESLLHALEAELLSTTDEEIRDALGRHQPARIAVRTVSTAVAMPDISTGGATSLPAFDQSMS
jgi:hypothetical protein